MMQGKSTLQLSAVKADINSELALTDINLQLCAGEVTAVIGPNGAGKTSLLRAICSELDCEAGRIEFHGQEMVDWNLHERASLLAILPQRSTLDFPFTVSEVVSLGRIPHETSQKRNDEIVWAALELVDCERFADRLYVHLSGGEKQRVQLARVAAQIWEKQNRDRCLILDEPSASLDLAHQAMIVDMMQFFSEQDVAILAVLHDLNLASKCADQICVLNQGRLVSYGTPNEVLTKEMLAQVFAIEAEVSVNRKDGSCLIIS